MTSSGPTKINAVAGQTAPIYLYLRIDGAIPTNPDGTALTMAGMSCALICHDYHGDVVAIVGPVTVENAVDWLVKYSPNALDLAPGANVETTYRARIEVTDSGGKKGYFPSAGWDALVIRPA